MSVPAQMTSFTTIKPRRVIDSRPRPRGINLIELVLAIALCGMALLAVVGVQWRHHKAMQKDTVRIEARAIASSVMNQMETILRGDFDGNHTLELSPAPPELDPGGRFQYLVKESYDDVEGNLKKVDVEVHWESDQGPRKEVLWCVFLRGE